MVLETRSRHFLFPILLNIHQRGWSGVKSYFAPKLSKFSWSDYCEKSEERSKPCVASDYSEANRLLICDLQCLWGKKYARRRWLKYSKCGGFHWEKIKYVSWGYQRILSAMKIQHISKKCQHCQFVESFFPNKFDLIPIFKCVIRTFTYTYVCEKTRRRRHPQISFHPL